MCDDNEGFDDFDTQEQVEEHYDDSMRQDEMDTAEDYNRWEEEQVFRDREHESDYRDPSDFEREEKNELEAFMQWGDSHFGGE